MEIDLISQLYRRDFTKFKYPVWESKWNTIILVESGEYRLKLENWQKPVILRENDIAFITPGIHFERTALTTIAFYHFAFRTQADHPFYRSMNVGKLSLPSERAKPVFQSLAQIMNIPNNRELITHTIEHIFTENYLFGESKKTEIVPFSEEIADTVNYINRHLDQPLDIDSLAARVFLSHSGLLWKFKKELGTTPSRYVSLQRIRHAKQLLLNCPDYTVTQIAELCGYSNPFYFTNKFREYSGMSPSEFRHVYLKK